MALAIGFQLAIVPSNLTRLPIFAVPIPGTTMTCFTGTVVQAKIQTLYDRKWLRQGDLDEKAINFLDGLTEEQSLDALSQLSSGVVIVCGT